MLIDGGWGAWASWTSCSKTCGGGVLTRIRLCNKPRPLPEGLPCPGNATSEVEEALCNTFLCPETGFPTLMMKSLNVFSLMKKTNTANCVFEPPERKA